MGLFMQNQSENEMPNRHIGPGGHFTINERVAQPIRGRHAGRHSTTIVPDGCCPAADTSGSAAMMASMACWMVMGMCEAPGSPFKAQCDSSAAIGHSLEMPNTQDPQKIHLPATVTPAEAGIQRVCLDARFRVNDTAELILLRALSILSISLGR